MSKVSELAASDLLVDDNLLSDTGDRGIRVAQLDAPRRRNALTPRTVEHLRRVFADRPSATVVLGSSTSDIFCAGADLSIDDDQRAALSDALYACYEVMVTRPGWVIAVVEGPAVGGGAQLSAAADVRVASFGARWQWVGPRHGLAVGAWILPDLVGRSRALELTGMGRWLDAREASAAGFARVVTDPWEEALRVARQLGEADAGALSRLKAVANRGPLLERLRAERTDNLDAWDGAARMPHA